MRKRNGILILAAVMTVASLLILNFVRWKMIGSETEQSLQLKQNPRQPVVVNAYPNDEPMREYDESRI
jgi:hypothetical protein